MTESPSQHGWKVVNSFAEGRQMRDLPLPEYDVSDDERELYEPTEAERTEEMDDA